MRIDKYLWAVRVFKTRTQAGEACRTGKVRIGQDSVKASREAKIGDVIHVQENGIVRSFELLALLPTRVGAEQAKLHVKEITPEDQIEAARLRRKPAFEFRLRGLGRPTKRDRREIDRFKIDSE